MVCLQNTKIERFTRMLLMVLLLSMCAYAQNRERATKLTSELHSVDPDSTVRVIVQYKRTPQDAHYQKMADRGGSSAVKLHSINSAAFRIPARALADLDADDEIVHVSLDRPISSTARLDPDISAHMAAVVTADLAVTDFHHQGLNVGVAVIDSGVSDNPDLHLKVPYTSRIVYSRNFVPNSSTTDDLYGHGTFVAGAIAGNGANSKGYLHTYYGLTPHASIINLRVLDRNGMGTDSSVIAAIQEAIRVKDTYNIRVINLSIGRAVYESYKLDPLCQAVEQAWKAGIIVVAAAGNGGRSVLTQGYATIAAPSNDPYVITVGAANTMGAANRLGTILTSYSSKGPTLVDHVVKPDLVAPGNGLISIRVPGSTLDNLLPDHRVTGDAVTSNQPVNYFQLSGTSMAAPLVSSAAVMMIQQDATLTPDQVKARLMKSAWKGLPAYSTGQRADGSQYRIQDDIFTLGAGLLDTDAALRNQDVAVGAALSPVAIRNSLTGNVRIDAGVYGTSVVWGDSVVWDDPIVWGSSVLLADSVVWGDSVVWDDPFTAAYRLVWGNTQVSSDSTVGNDAAASNDDQ